MSRTRTLLVAGAVALVAANAGAPAHAHDHDHLIRPVVTTDADWAPVVAAIGRTGKLSADGTSYKVGFPRRDLTVTSYRVAIKPSFALAGNASFARYPGGHAMLMGDLVVTEAEAPAVTDALQAGGIAQTAIHKHLLAESPPLWWMHIGGMGDPAVLARAVKAAIDKTATPPPAPPAPPGTVDLDTAGIDAALGGKGTVDGGVYKFTFARHETITEDGHVIPPGLGVTTALNFQPLGGGRAAINGDFAMTTARSNMSWPRCAAAGSPSSRCTTTPWTTTRGCSTPTSGPPATASPSPRRSAPAWTGPPSFDNRSDLTARDHPVRGTGRAGTDPTASARPSTAPQRGPTHAPGPRCTRRRHWCTPGVCGWYRACGRSTGAIRGFGAGPCRGGADRRRRADRRLDRFLDRPIARRGPGRLRDKPPSGAFRWCRGRVPSPSRLLRWRAGRRIGCRWRSVRWGCPVRRCARRTAR